MRRRLRGLMGPHTDRSRNYSVWNALGQNVVTDR